MTMTQLHGRTSLKGLGIKLSPTQKYLSYMGFVIVAISGVWWSLLHDALASKSFELMHNLLVTHGASAFISLIILGALMPQHMRLAWHVKRNRMSGGIMAMIALVIVVTGFGLYYSNEYWRDPIKWTHLIVGLVSIAALILHIWYGRRSNKAHLFQAIKLK